MYRSWLVLLVFNQRFTERNKDGDALNEISCEEWEVGANERVNYDDSSSCFFCPHVMLEIEETG